MNDQHDSPATAPDNVDLTFSIVRLKPGYAVREVNDFLAMATSELASPPDQRSTAPDSLRQKRFTATTRWAKGYSQDEVDAFLALLAAQLDQDASQPDH